MVDSSLKVASSILNGVVESVHEDCNFDSCSVSSFASATMTEDIESVYESATESLASDLQGSMLDALLEIGNSTIEEDQSNLDSSRDRTFTMGSFNEDEADEAPTQIAAVPQFSQYRVAPHSPIHSIEEFDTPSKFFNMDAFKTPQTVNRRRETVGGGLTDLFGNVKLQIEDGDDSTFESPTNSNEVDASSYPHSVKHIGINIT